ncbi:hypothetical protein BSLG_005885 [Batrachochytrium salamandrivorans]|nr:hypothetical protein BSLG_005885 [Batrachochytrium salamandrivorans]
MLVKEVASVMQEYTQSGGVTFWCSLLIAGIDETGPTLYQVDPSGSYWAWKGIGDCKNMVNARTFLEKEGIEGKVADTNIEIGVCQQKETINRDGEKVSVGTFRSLSAEIKDYLANIQ